MEVVKWLGGWMEVDVGELFDGDGGGDRVDWMGEVEDGKDEGVEDVVGDRERMVVEDVVDEVERVGVVVCGEVREVEVG